MGNFKYGWIPQKEDSRDIQYKVGAPVKLQTVHLKDKYIMPPIFNQGNIGSCGGNGGAYALAFDVLNKDVQNDVQCVLPFSRLFIYGNARKLEGTFNQDSGVQIRDVLKSAAAVGACSEKSWDYDEDKFADEPPTNCFTEALQFKAMVYSSINNFNKSELVGSLLQGLPFIFGFTVYESFESEDVANTGIVPMPGSNEQMMGGHCVVGVGYTLETDMVKCANSWGDAWGQKGYFDIPAAYLTGTMASDFWNIKTIL